MGLCDLRHVKANKDCQENPAGLSSYMMVVPLDEDHIGSIAANDNKNTYDITPPSGSTALKGFKVEFKSNTGKVSSEHNGEGTGWTHTGTWRVDTNEDDMAVLGRRLNNMGGHYLCFFPTGKTTNEGKEWKVVGNPDGDIQYSSGNDSGSARTDDHGTTPQVVCNYQVYDTMKWFGTIEEEEEAASSN